MIFSDHKMPAGFLKKSFGSKHMFATNREEVEKICLEIKLKLQIT